MKSLLPRAKCAIALYLLIGFLSPISADADDLIQTIENVKPSIVGIGTFLQLRSPAVSFAGTGFVVGDGLSVITNAHVIPEVIDDEHKESLRVTIGKGTEYRNAVLIGVDKLHDLALLRITGAPLPVMKVGDSNTIREGQTMAFTGFPLTAVLGFHPATHRAMIAAITVVATQAPNAKTLDAKAIVQMQKNAFDVFQLDGTAYPGGSGSPLYDPDTGVVYGVINKVLNATKEAAITNPSGITYAIPSNFVRELMQKQP
jgi:S1-C subfamily serine protease